jgi:transaldolase
MTDEGVLGVTSNPTILQQAIVKSELYDQELQELAEKTDDAKKIFRHIAVRDIQDASDIFMPVYEQTEHKDGYVSLERVMNLGENRIGMRIPRSAWFLRDLRFPHS